MLLDIENIRTDGGTQPRATYHYGHVDSYAEDMAAGATLPPVTVFFDGDDYWLADGFHRLLAAKKIGQSAIDADVRQGTLQDAQWYSYSVNQTHGLRRSNEDKRRAVEAALRHPYHAGMSDQAIADHCGVSRVYVNQISNQVVNVDNLSRPTSRKGRDGKTYNTENTGKTKRSPKPAPVIAPEDDDPIEEPAAAPTPAAIFAAVDDPEEAYVTTIANFSAGLHQLISATIPGGLPQDVINRIMDAVTEAIAAREGVMPH